MSPMFACGRSARKVLFGFLMRMAYKMGNLSRRDWMASAIAAGAALAGRSHSESAPATETQPPDGTPPKARTKTLFGIGYETWFLPSVPAGGWGTAEPRPVLGHYSSLDTKVIRQHAHWIHDAGIGFILIDWSNNLLGGNWTNGVAVGSIVRDYAHRGYCWTRATREPTSDFPVEGPLGGHR